MDRTPRIPPPSAMDGYRRLARTRSGEPIVRTVAAEDLPPRRRVGASRLAGALRLAGFLSVIAVIVGTSVTLASADPDETTTREPARTPAAVTEPTTKPARAKVATPITTAALDATDAPAPMTTVAASEPSAAAAPAPASAPAPRPTATLPLTGEPSVEHVLLAGASLVLLGMLVQIAGQPLPAQAAARARG